jgi:signal transduction histidine kinase
MMAMFTTRRLLRSLRSLQWQLAVSYAAMAALLCLALGLVIVQVLGQILTQQDQADVQSRAVIVGDIIYRDISQQLNLPLNLSLTLDEASQYSHARVCIYAATGAADQLGCSSAGLTTPQQGSVTSEIDYGVSSNLTPIAPYGSIINGQSSSVFGFVRLDEPLTFRQATEQRSRAAILEISLVATAVAAGAGLILGRGLTAPLRALTEAARRLGSGNLHARAPEDGDDEIGELGAQFNRMASQLQDSFATLESERDALRTFIADMSHELRTPITALHTFNDLLAEGAAADEEVRDEFLTESGKQIERLEWLAQNLLDLSKFDAGLAEVRMQCVDLRPMVARAVEEARLAGERKHVSVLYEPPTSPLEAPADAKRLEQALSNVLLNGVKFTPAGGVVTVSMSRENGHAGIYVKDTGPGIPSEELPHIFERFYRGPSTATLASGSGLGLPIVQSIMHAHAGDVEVHSEPGKGTEVVLTLPSA